MVESLFWRALRSSLCACTLGIERTSATLDAADAAGPYLLTADSISGAFGGIL